MRFTLALHSKLVAYPVLCCSALIGASALPAQPLRVDITEGARAPLQISLVATQPDSDPAVTTSNSAAQLLGVIEADLADTALYTLVRQSAAPGTQLENSLSDARARASQGLVWFTTAPNDANNLRAECSYIDVFSGAAEARAVFIVPSAQARRAAHKCADMVFTHTSGEPGYFDSQIALITDEGLATDPKRRVTIVDSDGFNLRAVSAPDQMPAMPAISRNGLHAAYLAIEGTETALIILDRTTGRQQRVQIPGALPSAPVFAPDGRSLLLTLSRDGNADIFRFELASGTFTPLTNAFGTDTAASYAPDGSKVVFQSDRSGQPQIYTMNADGSDQQRVSFGDGSFATPVWSPRGDRLAFTFVTDNGMQIGTMRSDGTAMRLLPAPWQDESPSWAASGTQLIFTRTTRSSPPRLWVTDLTGQRQRQFPLPMAASEASWSGLLP